MSLSIAELKEAISSGKRLSGIYVLSGDSFLAEQYAKAMAGSLAYPVDDLGKSIADGSIDRDGWAICRCTKFSMPKEGTQGIDAIVICQSADCETYEFPKPEGWQLLEYAVSLCPGVQREKLSWLCGACENNPWRVDSECSKIAPFPRERQDSVFDLLNSGDAFADLGGGRALDVANALEGKDSKQLALALSSLSEPESEPLALIALLRKGLTGICSIRMGRNPNAESCGMSSKQFAFLSRNVARKWKPDELVGVLGFVDSYDALLKDGAYPLDKKEAIRHISAVVASHWED